MDPVSDGYSVVMADLESAASTFSAEASTLRGLIPEGGPACPDGGDGTIDGAMHAALGKIGSLSQSLAAAMAAHGQKLAKAHVSYSRAETSATQFSHELLTALTRGGSTG